MSTASNDWIPNEEEMIAWTADQITFDALKNDPQFCTDIIGDEVEGIGDS